MGVDIFKKDLKEIGIELSEDKLQAFENYYKTLVEWNEFMNLTGITEHDEVMLKHYVDSLAVNVAIKELRNSKNPEAVKLYDKIDLDRNIKVIDIGTGAGFPGIPMKIAFSNLKVTLLDSLNKRIKFLNEVITQNNLTEIDTIHGRAEDFARLPEYREQYELCVSRAVANLATLSELCLPFVRVSGAFIAYKSGDIEEELKESQKAIAVLGGEVVLIKKFTLPNSDIERSFVVIKKVRNTAGKYPRKAGLPGKEPITN